MSDVMDAHARVFAAQFAALHILEAVKGPTRETRAMRNLIEASIDGLFGTDADTLTDLEQRICLHMTAAKHKRGAA
jgi:hypothetical protein